MKNKKKETNQAKMAFKIFFTIFGGSLILVFLACFLKSGHLVIWELENGWKPGLIVPFFMVNFISLIACSIAAFGGD